MTIFDLLFILVVLASLVTLVGCAIALLTGRRARGVAVLWRWASAAGLYLLVAGASSFLLPWRPIGIGEPICSDDWCIAVTGVREEVTGEQIAYDVGFQLTNRARRAAMRERDVIVYLLDDHGGRYEPLANSQDLQFDVRLQPEQSVPANRQFLVPAAARDLRLVVAKAGVPWGAWLILGRDPFERKFVRLN